MNFRMRLEEVFNWCALASREVICNHMDLLAGQLIDHSQNVAGLGVERRHTRQCAVPKVFQAYRSAVPARAALDPCDPGLAWKSLH